MIAFGGSYGGMLTAWMRFKYPHVIQGGIAASAPIRYFKGATEPEAFNEIITNSFRNASHDCPDVIKESWNILEQAKNRPETWDEISSIFNTCKPIKKASDLDDLYNYM